MNLKSVAQNLQKHSLLIGSSDVEVYDLICELNIIRFTLPNGVMSPMEIFGHVR